MYSKRRDQDPLELVLSRLEGVIPLGAGWMARCPSHDDRTQSLSVIEGEIRAVVLHCFAGCFWPDIVRAIGLMPRDLARRGPGGGSRNLAPPSESVPRYTPLSWGKQAWLDRAQRALRRPELLRLRDEKGIAAWVAEGAHMGWDGPTRSYIVPYYRDAIPVAADRYWLPRDRSDDGPKARGLQGHSRPLFVPDAVLTELLDDRLLVCEGPMDALTACSRVRRAVAAPSAFWRADFAGRVVQLAPGKVTVVGDCDEAGRKFAREAATGLAALGLLVEILDLDPARHDGYDLGDFLREGQRLP